MQTTITGIAVMLFMAAGGQRCVAQTVHMTGVIVDDGNGKPVEYASLRLQESGQWAVSDSRGTFSIAGVALGKVTLVVQCLGYAKSVLTVDVVQGMAPLKLRMKPENLKLDEVEVVAKRNNDESTTSYTIDRMALTNRQILNIGDVTSLLPGGKTVNGTLMNDSRLALRSLPSEKGNASFGTAIEVDGIRVSNNAVMNETMAAGTRNISSADVESVEIVAGIPSVEYGDLSNGIVRVHMRRGRSPFIIESKVNRHTTQMAVSKGFGFGHRGGTLNASLEHARSFSDAASPHTAYRRNVLSLRYSRVLTVASRPLTLGVGFSGNVGGYNSETDPDEDLDDYAKVRDNAWRGNVGVEWLLDKPWITNLSFKGAVSYSDKRSETYSNTSSASAQPYIHTTEEGYFIAADYARDPTAGIILGPTGYWYVRRYGDSRPIVCMLKLKADWSRRFGRVRNRLMSGVDFERSRNLGRGVYYEKMALAPTWREYRYDRLPAVNNLAFYVEDKATVATGKTSGLDLTVGIRHDMTLVRGSSYGGVSSFSPRANVRYVFWHGRRTWLRSLSMHAGMGKSVKLPSFQVLYPAPSYSDRLAFAPGSTADNRSYYAYHTYPSAAVFNSDLKWQHTRQTDIGVRLNLWGTRVTVSAFHHKTFNPYMCTSVYRPYLYKFTGQAAIENTGVPSPDRAYTVDRHSGVVTLTDLSGAHAPMTLAYSERRSYVSNAKYVNASPVDRYGLEWIVDFARVRALGTSLRLDGNYYYYKGTDETLFADIPVSVNSTGSDGQPYSYVGYYRGGDVTSAGYRANASVANGSMSRRLNLNVTVTTHIPRIRMIVALRLESSLYRSKRLLSEYRDGSRGYVLNSGNDYFGTPYDGTSTDRFVAVYPEYYSTWDDPATLIPFAEKFSWARTNDRRLYNDLAKLVVRSNYAYTMNPDKVSCYYSANVTVTKEIGDHVSVSFYANNFWNTMRRVRSSQTGLETSLFGSGYIPDYYYGLSMNLKI